MQEPGEKRKTVGQRSRKLDKAFHSTVKYALRGSPVDEFETYFPPDSLPEAALSAAYDAYAQCLHQARVFIDREFEEICEEANIADKLQTIDVLCAEQGFDGTKDVSTCASQGPQMARIATIKAKKQALEHLKAIKQDCDIRNDQLLQTLEERKKEARQLQSDAFPGGQRLENIHRIAHAWESSGL